MAKASNEFSPTEERIAIANNLKVGYNPVEDPLEISAESSEIHVAQSYFKGANSIIDQSLSNYTASVNAIAVQTLRNLKFVNLLQDNEAFFVFIRANQPGGKMEFTHNPLYCELTITNSFGSGCDFPEGSIPENISAQFQDLAKPRDLGVRIYPFDNRKLSANKRTRTNILQEKVGEVAGARSYVMFRIPLAIPAIAPNVDYIE